MAHAIWLDAAPPAGLERFVVYDMDGTLITPKSGRKVPRRNDLLDWQYKYPKALPAPEAGTAVVIYTNQAGLKTDAECDAFVAGKVRPVSAAFDGPVHIVVGGGYGVFRKPKTAGWRAFCDRWVAEHGGEPHKVPVLVVGDAAGRPGDFADTDLTFARNIGARFETPEHHFLGHPNMVGEPAFVPDATENPDRALDARRAQAADFFAHPRSDPEVVLMCGRPGSGKSAWIREHAPAQYYIVSRDVLKTKAKCLAAMGAHLERGESVIVDNTFMRIFDRYEYAAAARARRPGTAVRCVELTTPADIADHLNALRAEHPTHPKPRVPPMVIRMMRGKYEQPTTDNADQLSEVLRVPWAYSATETPPELYRQWHC